VAQAPPPGGGLQPARPRRSRLEAAPPCADLDGRRAAALRHRILTPIAPRTTSCTVPEDQAPGAGWGFLATTTEGSQYLPVLGAQKNTAKPGSQRLRLLASSPSGWPLLHYGETNSVSLAAGPAAGEAEREVQGAARPMIDLHKRVRRQLADGRVSSLRPSRRLASCWASAGARRGDGARCLLMVAPVGAAMASDRGSRAVTNLLRILRYNRGRLPGNLGALATWLLTQGSSGGALTGTHPVGR